LEKIPSEMSKPVTATSSGAQRQKETAVEEWKIQVIRRELMLMGFSGCVVDNAMQAAENDFELAVDYVVDVTQPRN
jgi:N-acetylmuramoyl-L-alanine amidase CwlA